MARETKVVFFSPRLSHGGLERVIVRLLEHLDPHRFQVSLVVVRPGGELLTAVPSGIPVTVLGSTRLAASIPALARHLKQHAPDVVFAGGGAGPVAVLARIWARASTRVIVSERSALRRPDRTRARTTIDLALKAVTYRRADLVTAVSEGVRGELISALHLHPDRVRTLYNPMVDESLLTQATQPSPHPWLRPVEQTPVFVAVGRLVEIKDYPTMLKAFALLIAQHSARLLILGEGDHRDQLEALIRDLQLEDAVQLVGFDDNPHAYMARAVALLHASRAEGLPGVLIQAMACGTPAVSTDCDFGPREIIQESGVDGFLVPIGDADALADRALTLLRRPVLRHRMGQAAKRSAQRFTNDRTLEAYAQALMGAQ